VKLLLDEASPFALYRRLRDAGRGVEHVIGLARRATGDIRELVACAGAKIAA